MNLENVSPDPALPALFRRREAAKFLGISVSTLWRLQGDGVIRPVRIVRGVSAFKVEELQALVAGLPPDTPDRKRVEKALASQKHGRPGRVPASVKAESIPSVKARRS